MSKYPYKNPKIEKWKQSGGPSYICENEYSEYYGAETPYSFGCTDYEDKEGY